MAPEVALRYGFTEAADMWSMGTMIYELILGERPFALFENHDDQKCEERLQTLFGPHTEGRLSPDAQDLITNLLKLKPADRLTAWEALRHPFFTDEETDNNMLCNTTIGKFEMFARRGQLQKALFPLMQEHSLQKNEFLRQHYIKMVNDNDIHGDGELGLDCFTVLLENGGVNKTEKEVKAIFDGLCMEGKETIGIAEILSWFEYDYIMSQDERLWSFVAKLDIEGNGKISRQNMEDAIEKYHGEEFGEYLILLTEIFDSSEKGYEDFAKLFRGDMKPTIFDASPDSSFSWSSSSSIKRMHKM